MNTMDINILESLNYFNEQQEQEEQRMREYNNMVKYQQFKEEMLKYGDFSEEELMEMFEAEMLVEYDL